MQVFFRLLLITLLLFSFKLTFAQTNTLKIRGSFSNKPLSAVLLSLEIDYRLKFEYEKEDIKDIRINTSFSRMPVENAMAIILDGTPLSFELISARRIRLLPREDVPVMEVSKTTYQPSNFDFTLSGIIKDKNSGESLPFASVVVKGTLKGTSTNADGYFTLFNVPSDTAFIEIQYLGYQKKILQLNPEMNMDNLEIVLEDFSQQLDAITIVATKEEQMIKASTGISTIGVTPAQLSTLPSFGEKDIFRSLQLLPGISGSNESSSGLFVRGGTPDQNLILFDGFTVYHVDHLFGFFSAFNSNAIKDVQIYKGGFDARYGGRLSSVVELTGKDGNSEYFNAGVGLSLLSYNGFVESPFVNGKGSILLAGRRSFQSSFYNNLFDSFTQANRDANSPANIPQGVRGRFGQQEVQPNSYFYDLNAKITFRPSDNDIISLSFYNGQDDLDNSRITDSSNFGGGFFGRNNNNFTFSSENIDLTNWGNWGTSLRWSHKWTNQLYSVGVLSYSNYYSERDRTNTLTVGRTDTTTTRTTGSYEFNDLKDFSFKMDNEWKINESNQLFFGVQYTYNDIQYDFTQNDTSQILDRMDTGATSTLYVQDKMTINDRLILSAGLRANYYDVTEAMYLEPRASLTYLLSDKFKIKGAYGQYNQFATRIVREDIQQGSRDFWLLANDENVPISFAEHFISGISYETNDYLFDVEGYYKNLDGLSEYTTRFTPSGLGPDRTLNYEEFFFQGTGIAKGVEFLLQKKVGKINGWVSYTLGQVRYDFDAFGEEPFPANQDQTHELKIVANYKINNWTFGGTFIYATGRPYTAPTGYYEVTLLDGSTADFFEVSDKNALRLPDYHRLDFSVTHDFDLWGSKANAGLSLFNIYNRSNLWYKEYEVIEGELLETDISLIDFTPSLFFNVKLR